MSQFCLSWKSLRRALLGAACAIAMPVMAVPVSAETKAPKQDDVPLASTLPGHYLSALQAGRNRDLINAARFYRNALKADPDNLQLLERSFILSLASGNIEQALAMSEILAKSKVKGRNLPYITLAIRALKEREYKEAQRHLDRIEDGRLGLLTKAMLTAWALQGAGKTDDAIKVLDDLAVTKDTEWYKQFKLFHKGLIASVAGRKDAATSAYNEAVKDKYANLRLLEATMRQRGRAGDQKGALALVSKLSANEQRDPVFKQLIADLKAGKKPQPLYDGAQAGAAEAMINAASVLQNEWITVLAHYQLALYINPDFDIARMYLAGLYAKLKMFAPANALFRELADTSPYKTNARIQIALNLEEQSKRKEASEVLNKVLEQEPGNIQALLSLGNLYHKMKNYQGAAENFSKVITQYKAKKSENWQIYYSRGIAYERSKQWPRAEADFKRALELSPDQPDVLNYLGYSWVDQGLHYDKALKMLEKAAKLRPNDGYIIDSLGWVYYKLERYEEAVKSLEVAVELQPGEAVVNDHLGDAYWRVGRYNEARFQWLRAKNQKPTEKELEQIEKKLKNGLPDANADTKKEAKASTATEAGKTNQ